MSLSWWVFFIFTPIIWCFGLGTGFFYGVRFINNQKHEMRKKNPSSLERGSRHTNNKQRKSHIKDKTFKEEVVFEKNHKRKHKKEQQYQQYQQYEQ